VNLIELAHRKIVVTGASSGIGKAIVERLAVNPVEIMVVGRDRERLHALVDSLAGKPAKLYPYIQDVGSLHGNDAVFRHALQVMGGIDIFFANAGFAYYEKLDGPHWDHIDKIFSTNVYAPIYTAEKMAALNKGKAHTVVITTSAMAKLPLPGYALYGSTKAALDHFSETYRFERPKEQKLIMLYPIGTKTGFFKNAGAQETFMTQTPEQVAAAVVRAVETGRETVFPSFTFRLFWYATRIFPLLGRIYQSIEEQKFKKWLEQENKIDR